MPTSQTENRFPNTNGMIVMCPAPRLRVVGARHMRVIKTGGSIDAQVRPAKDPVHAGGVLHHHVHMLCFDPHATPGGIATGRSAHANGADAPRSPGLQRALHRAIWPVCEK